MSQEWKMGIFWSMCVHLSFFLSSTFGILCFSCAFVKKRYFKFELPPDDPSVLLSLFFNFAIPTMQMPSLIWFIWSILWWASSAVPLFTQSKEKPLHSPIWFFRQLIVVFPFVFELPYWNRFDDSKAYCDVYNHPNFVLCLF